MKPEVQAAIETRRQWFWVWVVGICGGFGLAITIQSVPADSFGILYLLIVLAGFWLFVATLRLQRALLAWVAFIAITTALTLVVLIGFVNDVLLS